MTIKGKFRHSIAFTFNNPGLLSLATVRKTGFTTLITGYKNLTPKTILSIKNSGLHPWVEVGCFVGEDLWEKYPSSRPAQNGKPVEKLGPAGNRWYAGVIPTKEVITDRLELIRSTLDNLLGVEALFLDFCRFPGRWEDGQGSAISGQNINRDGDEKQYIITSFIADVRKLCDARRVPLGIFLTPDDHAVYGQNLGDISMLCRFSAPMLYHAIYRKPVSWIGDRLDFFRNKVSNDIIPVIQSLPEPIPLTIEEFRSAIHIADNDTQGLMILNFEAMDNTMREEYKNNYDQPHT